MRHLLSLLLLLLGPIIVCAASTGVQAFLQTSLDRCCLVTAAVPKICPGTTAVTPVSSISVGFPVQYFHCRGPDDKSTECHSSAYARIACVPTREGEYARFLTLSQALRRETNRACSRYCPWSNCSGYQPAYTDLTCMFLSSNSWHWCVLCHSPAAHVVQAILHSTALLSIQSTSV